MTDAALIARIREIVADVDANRCSGLIGFGEVRRLVRGAVIPPPVPTAYFDPSVPSKAL